MTKHNMSGMDAASKLLMANEAVAKDAINYILRNSGYVVVENSMQVNETRFVGGSDMSLLKSKRSIMHISQ